MEGHHITDTKLVKDETSANTGTRGIILTTPFEHNRT